MSRGQGSGIGGRGFRAFLSRLRSRPPIPDPRPLIILAVIVAFIAALLALGAGVELRSFEQHRFDNHTGASLASSVAQSFRSTRANLSHIEVELGSYAGLPADGRVRLLAGDGLSGRPVFEAS